MNGAQQNELTRQALGLTLIGVLLSIAVTVGMGLSGQPWWVRLGAGAATGAGLLVLVGVAGRRTKALRRFAAWIVGGEEVP